MNMKIYKSVFIFLPLFITVFSLSGLGGVALAANENADFGLSNKPVCPGPANSDDELARCHARIVVDSHGAPKKGINGLTPAKLHTAYSTATTASGNPIIAITAAYHNANILNELNTYSQQFSIPTLPACVGSIAASAVPCFKQIDQNGGSSFPQNNPNWGLEISMDVEIAHAICQNCRILLVEANDNGINSLMTAIDQAFLQGANVISNSWGLGEIITETSFDSHLNHPGIAITFSSGDAGYGVQYPAASPYVTAVGGTTLNFTGNGNYSSETAWSGAGSGCSAYELKPTWQTDSGCIHRTVADVSAVANPATGAAIYNGNNWVTVGGTSLAAPIIAGIHALGGVPSIGIPISSVYANFSLLNFHDIVSGSNGSCGNSYLCTALAGFDGPTGLGTPRSAAAF
jgi:subtilase family serine protease